jgi:hypothetical protein
LPPCAANLDVKESLRSFTSIFAALRGNSEREGKPAFLHIRFCRPAR